MLIQIPKAKTKGQKKARRFNRPRSAAAKAACAKRKNDRREAQRLAHENNVARGWSAWDKQKEKRLARKGQSS